MRSYVMKYSEFITAVEDIYTPYTSEILKKLTIKYVKERWQESELDNVLAMLTVKHDPKYKTPPSPATFDESFPRLNLEAEASRWFDELTRTGNSLDHVIISDLRAQEAVHSFGGWPGFCQRKPEDEHWHRKNFISAYVKAVPESNQPHILFGESTRREKLPLMFGDKSICAAALEYHKGEAMNLITDMTAGMKA
jgi:hypothetical protein